MCTHAARTLAEARFEERMRVTRCNDIVMTVDLHRGETVKSCVTTRRFGRSFVRSFVEFRRKLARAHASPLFHLNLRVKPGADRHFFEPISRKFRFEESDQGVRTTSPNSHLLFRSNIGREKFNAMDDFGDYRGEEKQKESRWISFKTRGQARWNIFPSGGIGVTVGIEAKSKVYR